MRCGIFAAAAALVAGGPAVAAITNGGFESGNFGSSTHGFAGGSARFLTDRVPTGWVLATSNTGNADRWVTSIAAHSGKRYVYLSSSQPLPNTDCLQAKDFDCWKEGETWSYSAWVASADNGAATNRFQFEVREFLSGGGFIDTVYSFDLPANPAWSHTALTTIPWQQVTHTHTFRADTVNVDFWVSAAQDASGGTSSIAIDDVACKLVPGPGAGVVLLAAFGLAGRRCR